MPVMFSAICARSLQDRSMRSRGPLIGLLVLATVAVDLVVLVELAARDGNIDRAPGLLLLGMLYALMFSQGSLLAIWVGLARRPAPWPLATTIVAGLTWAVSMGILCSQTDPVPVEFLAVMTLIQMAAVIVPLWIVRLVGARLVAAPDHRPGGRTGPDRPGQFSIGYLLGWMTAGAIVLGLVRWTLSAGVLTMDGELWRSPRFWWVAARIVAGNALIAWSGAWAMLGTRRLTLRALAPCLALGLVVGYYYVSGASEHTEWMSFIYAGQTALLVGSLGVVRIDGFRLLGRGGATESVGY